MTTQQHRRQLGPSSSLQGVLWEGSPGHHSTLFLLWLSPVSHTCGHHRTILPTSPSTFMWGSGNKRRSSGLCSKHFDLVSHLDSPLSHLSFSSAVCVAASWSTTFWSCRSKSTDESRAGQILPKKTNSWNIFKFANLEVSDQSAGKCLERQWPWERKGPVCFKVFIFLNIKDRSPLGYNRVFFFFLNVETLFYFYKWKNKYLLE